MLQNIEQFKVKAQEVEPSLNASHLQSIIFLGSVVFAISLAIGVVDHRLGFLCESLMILTLIWASYRGSFPGALILLGYLLVAKSYQLIFFTELNLVVRLISLGISVLMARSFYLGSVKSDLKVEKNEKVFDLLDVLFAITISMVAVSISAVAIENYELQPNYQSVSNLNEPAQND